MLNHLKHNFCIEKTTTIALAETDGVYKYCPNGYTYNGSDCIKCFDANYYTLLPYNICVERCIIREADDFISKTCTICKEYNMILF